MQCQVFLTSSNCFKCNCLECKLQTAICICIQILSLPSCRAINQADLSFQVPGDSSSFARFIVLGCAIINLLVNCLPWLPFFSPVPGLPGPTTRRKPPHKCLQHFAFVILAIFCTKAQTICAAFLFHFLIRIVLP